MLLVEIIRAGFWNSVQFLELCTCVYQAVFAVSALSHFSRFNLSSFLVFYLQPSASFLPLWVRYSTEERSHILSGSKGGNVTECYREWQGGHRMGSHHPPLTCRKPTAEARIC